MGNCIKTFDTELHSIASVSFAVDTKPIKESGLPIIFIIGGPGAGKRTLCSKVAEKYDFLKIISADIIRQEVAKRTERAFVLARMMSEGHLVPTDILLELITVNILANLHDKKGIVVSGFPRRRSQCQVFDREVRPPDLVLFLNVQNSVLSDRIMARSITTTERPVISYDLIKRDIKEFHQRNLPIVKHYKKLLAIIDGNNDAKTVYEDACTIIDDLLTNLQKTASASGEVETVASADEVTEVTEVPEVTEVTEVTEVEET